jgi:hypothetical protein
VVATVVVDVGYARVGRVTLPEVPKLASDCHCYYSHWAERCAVRLTTL